MDGQNIKVEKYSYSRPSDRLSKNNFDNHVAFEEYSSSQFLQDNLTSDPATRFQIVKNAFERCLNDALVCLFFSSRDITFYHSFSYRREKMSVF